MGRKKKYFTEEEKQEANRQKVKDYYYRHKDEVDKKAKERYWFNKDCKKYNQEIMNKEEELQKSLSKEEKESFIQELKSLEK